MKSIDLLARNRVVDVATWILIWLAVLGLALAVSEWAMNGFTVVRI